jgi:hypothetical protein
MGRADVEALLTDSLAAVGNLLAPAGLELRRSEVNTAAAFEHGTGGALVRSVEAVVCEAGDDDETRRITVVLHLVVDLGEPGDTAMTLALQLSARRGEAPAFLLGRRFYVGLDQYYAECMRAKDLMTAALERLVEVHGVDCQKMVLEFCQQFLAELEP